MSLTIRNHLREILASISMTQNELAERSGVGQQYVSRLVLGQTLPGVVTAIRISRALGLSVEEVWNVGIE